MADRTGLYTRVIGGLKVVLPLAALAMLSTLFLLARSIEPTSTLPFSDLLGENVLTGEQVGTPYYAGSTERGDLLTVTAKRARPDGLGQIMAEEVAATIVTVNGSTVNMSAPVAELADKQDSALLQGGVVVTSSMGYTLRTQALRTALSQVEAETLGPISGTGPAGTLDAGRLVIRPYGTQGDVQLLFTDGVKLIYHPQK